MTSWTYLWWFCEKNWILGYFLRIWHLRRDLEWPLWVMMTSNWIFKSRNRISIPKNSQNDYLSTSERLLWEKLDPGPFSRIWPLWHDLQRPLWVRMTSNWIFKSRNGFSIPKKPQNDYLNISEMLSEGIIGKLVQKLFQKMAKMRKSKNRNYQMNCTILYNIEEKQQAHQN